MNGNSRTRREVRRRRARGRAVFAMSVAALLALLGPLGLMFAQFWSSSGEAATFIASERGAVAYVRPLTKLLATLVDAQSAAVRGSSVDPAAVRAAVAEVDGVDRQSGDSVRVRQRWSQVPEQVESTLRRKATGVEALSAYASPIALAQALLTDIGHRSQIVRDPGLDAYHLIDSALFRLPEVIINAGQIAGLTHGTLPTPSSPEGGPAGNPGDREAGLDPRVAVASDRVTRAAEAIGVGLRGDVDANTTDAVDLNLLRPLDEFGAAVDALRQATLALGASGASANVGAAQRRVHKSAMALDVAVLATLDGLLDARVGAVDRQRRAALFAVIVAVVAAGALLWMRQPSRPAVRSSATNEDRRRPAGESGRPAQRGPAPGAGGPGGDPTGDLIDARELHDLVVAERSGRASRRREP